MKLLAKLAAMQEQIDGLSKNQSTGTYKYVDGSSVLNLIRPMMNAAKIILKQEVIDIQNIRHDYLVGRGEQRTKSEILTTLKMRFTWVDCESGETDVNEFAANGMNDWDKGVGSALTYGERYFLLKYFHVPTDQDDPDALESKRGNGHTSVPAKISDCKNTDDLNAYIDKHWISKMDDATRKELWAHAKSIGANYSKETKSFGK